MEVLQHLWAVVALLAILGGPVPLSVAVLQAHRRSERHSLAYSLLFVLTSWSVLQIALSLVLGSFHQLTFTGVMLTELAVLALGCLGLARQAFSWRRWRRALLTSDQSWQASERVLLASILLVGMILLERIATQPMTNFDSLWFHLPVIARWYQTGQLTLLDPAGYWVFEHPDAARYPYSWHTLSVLCLLSFKDDFLVGLPMLLAWAILGLATYLLSTYFGATRFYSLAATSLVLSVPMLLNHVTTLHVDLPVASFFTAGLYFALAYYRTRAPLELSLFLATMGVLAGIKTPGVVYAGLLMSLLTGLELYRAARTPNMIKALRAAVSRLQQPLIGLGLLTMLFLGSFWYVRNAWETGLVRDPFESFAGVSSGDSTQSGLSELWSRAVVLQQSTLTSQFDLTNPAVVKAYGIQLLLRLQLPFLALLAQVPLLAAAFLQRQRPSNSAQAIRRRTLLSIALLLLVTSFLYWNTPYSGQISNGEMSPVVGSNLRYGFSVLSVLGVAGAVSMTACQIPRQWVLGISLLSSFSGGLSSIVFDTVAIQSFVGDRTIWGGRIISQFQEAPLQAANLAWQLIGPSSGAIVIYTALYVGLITLAYGVLTWGTFKCQLLRQTRRLLKPSHRWFRSGLCVVLIVSLSWSMRQSREAHRDLFYHGIYDYIEDHTQPGEAIAYFDSDRSYLFYGKHLDRQVLHIPFDPNQPEQWLKVVRQSGVTYVATGPRMREKVYSAIVKLNQPSDVLTPIFGDDIDQASVLYEVVR